MVDRRNDLLSEVTLGCRSEFIRNNRGAKTRPGDTPLTLSALFMDAGDAEGINEPRLLDTGFSHDSVLGCLAEESSPGHGALT